MDCGKSIEYNIISAYANMFPNSEEPIYLEPDIFETDDILPVDLIRRRDSQ